MERQTKSKTAEAEHAVMSVLKGGIHDTMITAKNKREEAAESPRNNRRK